MSATTSTPEKILSVALTPKRLRVLTAAARGEAPALPDRPAALLLEGSGVLVWVRGGAFQITRAGEALLSRWRRRGGTE
jgi:hypothetical protein